MAKGTKANGRAKLLGGRHERRYTASFMKKSQAEKQDRRGRT
jgi:hypothetical protein